MRTGAAAPRSRRPAPAPEAPREAPQAPPTRGGNRPRSPEVASGLERVAGDQLLSEGEVLALGEALGTLMGTAGWGLIEVLLTRMQNHLAVQGIRDEHQSKDYVRGKLDFVDEFRGALASYIVDAARIAEKGDRHSAPDNRVVAAMIPGGRRRL